MRGNLIREEKKVSLLVLENEIEIITEYFNYNVSRFVHYEFIDTVT